MNAILKDLDRQLQRLALSTRFLILAIMTISISTMAVALLTSCIKNDPVVIQVQQEVDENTYAATGTMAQDGEVYYDMTCLWYYSDGWWQAIILSGTEIVDRRYYKTQEDLITDVKKAYAEIPMEKPAVVTAELIR